MAVKVITNHKSTMKAICKIAFLNTIGQCNGARLIYIDRGYKYLFPLLQKSIALSMGLPCQWGCRTLNGVNEVLSLLRSNLVGLTL